MPLSEQVPSICLVLSMNIRCIRYRKVDTSKSLEAGKRGVKGWRGKEGRKETRRRDGTKPNKARRNGRGTPLPPATSHKMQMRSMKVGKRHQLQSIYQRRCRLSPFKGFEHWTKKRRCPPTHTQTHPRPRPSHSVLLSSECLSFHG